MSVVRVAHGNLKDEVSVEEWRQRVDLAACYRLIAHFGWDDLIYTHISARLKDNPNQFPIIMNYKKHYYNRKSCFSQM